jgi:DNA gyrase subunit B
VNDDGRGIPVSLHSKTGISSLETVFSFIHAGGKFDNDAYKVSGGLHGVGATVVNALSDFLEVTVCRDGKKYFQRFVNGKIEAPLQELENTSKTGTIIKFKPSASIFKETTIFDYEIIVSRCEQLAFLNKNLTITVIDDRTETKNVFCYQGGIKEYVLRLQKDSKPLYENVFYFESKQGNTIVELTLLYNDGFDTNILSFCNNI